MLCEFLIFFNQVFKSPSHWLRFSWEGFKQKAFKSEDLPDGFLFEEINDFLAAKTLLVGLIHHQLLSTVVIAVSYEDTTMQQRFLLARLGFVFFFAFFLLACNESNTPILDEDLDRDDPAEELEPDLDQSNPLSDYNELRLNIANPLRITQGDAISFELELKNNQGQWVVASQIENLPEAIFFSQSDSINIHENQIIALNQGQAFFEVSLESLRFTQEVIIQPNRETTDDAITLTSIEFLTSNLTLGVDSVQSIDIAFDFSDASRILFSEIDFAETTPCAQIEIKNSDPDIAILDRTHGLKMKTLRAGQTSIGFGCDGLWATLIVDVVDGEVSTILIDDDRLASTIQNLTIHTHQTSLLLHRRLSLWVSFDFGDGEELEIQSFSRVFRDFRASDGLVREIQWESLNPEIIEVDAFGQIRSVGYGLATIEVSYGETTSQIEMKVELPDAPPNDGNYYLGEDDLENIVIERPASTTYGSLENILNEPSTSTSNVFSLGIGGQITIELQNYWIIDGPGYDFTVFENAMLVIGSDPDESDALRVFAERGEVSVSQDGITYYNFDCDGFDEAQIFSGCAGVTPTGNPADYDGELDFFRTPELSGGDTFDLADLDLAYIRFIRIRDYESCFEGAHPLFYPVCTGPSAGFDLNAIAIINGQNETQIEDWQTDEVIAY